MNSGAILLWHSPGALRLSLNISATTGFRGKMKIIKDEDGAVTEEDVTEEVDTWEFDWEKAEQVLNEVQLDHEN